MMSISGGWSYAWPESSEPIDSVMIHKVYRFQCCYNRAMPELPEVETVRAGLAELLPGRIFAAVQANWAKGFPNEPAAVKQFVVGARVMDVRRRAKVLLIDMSSSYTFVVHLKMTGQLVFRGEQNFGAGHPSDSLVQQLPDRSTRVIMDFTDGARLFFNDQRKFGWIKLMPTALIQTMDFFKRVGPEPLDDALTWQQFADRFQRRKGTSIKAALLDQSVIAGVGNIYADESLWRARIHPATRVAQLKKQQLKRLFESVQTVLWLGIEKGGSTDKNYVDAEGRKGSYLSFASVFRREGQPCSRCGAEIVKVRVAGRGTHICPICQVQKNVQ